MGILHSSIFQNLLQGALELFREKSILPNSRNIQQHPIKEIDAEWKAPRLN